MHLPELLSAVLPRPRHCCGLLTPADESSAAAPAGTTTERKGLRAALPRRRHQRGVLRPPAGGALAELHHLFPVAVESLPAGVAQAHEGLGLLLHEAFFDLDQIRLFELREMGGEIPH